jgi:hypothetical protein
MASSGGKTPTLAQNVNDGGTRAWTNTAYATGAADGSGAATTNALSTGQTSQKLQLYTFDFSAIPDGATILGVQVSVVRKYAAT